MKQVILTAIVALSLNAMAAEKAATTAPAAKPATTEAAAAPTTTETAAPAKAADHKAHGKKAAAKVDCSKPENEKHAECMKK